MNTVATTLKAIAAELREHPEHWCQGTWARDADGVSLSESDRSPVSWCAWGLCARNNIEVAVPTLSDAVGLHIVTWNDKPGRTALEVADAFDRAAELASQTAAPAGEVRS